MTPLEAHYNEEKRYDDAARLYCRMAGINPDLLIHDPRSTTGGFTDQATVIARELRDLNMRMLALYQTKPE